MLIGGSSEPHTYRRPRSCKGPDDQRPAIVDDPTKAPRVGPQGGDARPVASPSGERADRTCSTACETAARVAAGHAGAAKLQESLEHSGPRGRIQRPRPKPGPSTQRAWSSVVPSRRPGTWSIRSGRIPRSIGARSFLGSSGCRFERLERRRGCRSVSVHGSGRARRCRIGGGGRRSARRAKTSRRASRRGDLCKLVLRESRHPRAGKHSIGEASPSPASLSDCGAGSSRSARRACGSELPTLASDASNWYFASPGSHRFR